MAKAKDKRPERMNKVVGLRLYPEDERRFDDWVASIPEAEGNRSQAVRIFLRRWHESQKKHAF